MDQATLTMLGNVPEKTGRTLDEWFHVIDGTGLGTHGKILGHLKSEYAVSHGFANLIAARYLARGEMPASDSAMLDAQFTGRKAALRGLYDEVASAATGLGGDVEVVVKKTAVSFRRGRQFAYVEVPSAARVRVGLNLRGEPPTERLRAATGMCTHAVDLATPAEVDDEVRGWLRDAYERVG